MKNWSFWDWTGYIGIFVAALFLAIDTGIKGAPSAATAAPDIFKSTYFGFMPLLFLTAGSLALLLRALGWIQQSSKALTPVFNQVFENKIVQVDGKDFRDCTFFNVTFRYQGGAYNFSNANLTGHTRIETLNSSVYGTVVLLKMLGFLRPDFAADWKDYPPEHFKG